MSIPLVYTRCGECGEHFVTRPYLPGEPRIDRVCPECMPHVLEALGEAAAEERRERGEA